MNLNTPIYYDSNGNIDWLDDLIAYIIEQEGADLLSIICLFLDQNTCQIKNRDFIDFLKLVSRGELILPCEGFALELDKDLDEGKVFEGAVFDTENIYNIPSNVMPIEKFMNLLEYITNSYIKYHPNDKDICLLLIRNMREHFSKYLKG